MTVLAEILADGPDALWPLSSAYADLSDPANPVFFDAVGSLDLVKGTLGTGAFYDLGGCGPGGPRETPDALTLFRYPLRRSPAPPALNPGAGSWTVEAWARQDGSGGFPGIYHWGEPSPVASSGAMFNFLTGTGLTADAGFRWDAGGSAQLNDGYGFIGLGVDDTPMPLHHLVWTYDGAGQHYGYHDGVQTASHFAVLSAFAPGSPVLLVGDNGNFSGAEHVTLANVAVYVGSALSPTRVLTHYAAAAKSCEPIIGRLSVA